MDQILNNFKKSVLLVLGDVMLDDYYQGSCSRLSPEAPVPVFETKNHFTVLGGAANTAANIAALGGKVFLVGACASDSVGKSIIELCKKQNINFFPIHYLSKTTIKTRYIGNQQQLIRVDQEDRSPNSKESSTLNQILKILPKVNVVVFSDYNKGFLTEKICQAVIKECHKRSILCIADPKPENISFFRNCDFITPNWKESLQISSHTKANFSLDNFFVIGKKLSNKVKSQIVMTLGSSGVFFYDAKKKLNSFHLPTEAREVFDVSGAGDSFLAGFALCKSLPIDNLSAVRFANKVAGVSVGKLGTSVVYPNEVLSSEESWQSRLLNRKQLSEISSQLKLKGKRLVSINGSFDLLHTGHLYILEEAKKLGDVLIVGLNSDTSIKKYKSPSRPILSQNERAQMLLSLRVVDFVHIFDETTPDNFLKAYQPHIHANGEEYGKHPVEFPTLKKIGATLSVIKRIPHFSSTNIIQRIKDLRE